MATAWLLAGMDAISSLLSIDNEQLYQSIADNILGDDKRLQLLCTEAGEWLDDNQEIKLI